MQLLYPIWLIALGAISIPVAIHLWNIKPGKIRQVGSIALFEEASPANRRSLKLRDILLLALRCLLLMLAAVLLASPFWQKQQGATKNKGWVLIPRQYLSEVLQKFKPRIDSLSKKGYQLHYFNSGFPKITPEDISKGHTKPDSIYTDTPGYWTLTKRLSKYMPPGAKIELFAPNLLRKFSGNRPATALHINWHTFTPAGSVKSWLAQAYLTGNGDIHVLQGVTRPSGITYQLVKPNTGTGLNSAVDVRINKGLPVINLKGQPGIKIIADTATLRLAVYTGGNNADAAYLQAALEAVARFTQRKIQTGIYTDKNRLPAGCNWLFWLSDERPDARLAGGARHILYYARGKAYAGRSWLLNSLVKNAPGPALLKLIPAVSTPDETLWYDGYGHPVLTRRTDGKNTWYAFYSRFNPAWGSLVWDNRFPLWMMQLMLSPQSGVVQPDTRMIDNEQLQPVYRAQPVDSYHKQAENIFLTRYLWLLLALAFFMERWLVHRHKTQAING